MQLSVGITLSCGFWPTMRTKPHSRQYLFSMSFAPDTALEVGIGPFGLGVLGFLWKIPHRYGIDPTPAVSLEGANASHAQLLRFIAERKAAIPYVEACGEEIPFPSESMDLVICCNVIDHAYAPQAILKEIYRVLKPTGVFFLDVHTFSLLGLAKWHLWTKHVHKDESLVQSHPYRMFERNMIQELQSSAFQVRKLSGHTFVSSVIGHARASTFFATKATSS